MQKGPGLFCPVTLSEVIWRAPIVLHKNFRVIAEVIESTCRCDLCDPECGGFQQAAADLEPVMIQEIYRGLLQIKFEDDTAFAAADVPRGGYVA